MTEDRKIFSDRLLGQIDEKKSFIVVGLDPQYSKIPLTFKKEPLEKFGQTLKAISESIIVFNKCIIDVVAPLVPTVKPQIAFYEMYGIEGIRAFVKTVDYARAKGLIVIEDAKRNDIGTTAQAYADAHIGKVKLGNGTEQPVFGVDAITVNPYLGSDGIKPFLDNLGKYGKGIFVLVKTSNPSSFELQDLIIKDGNVRLFEYIAGLVNEWGKDFRGSRGYSSVGAVVGATFPGHAKVLRKIMPHGLFLVPGYGAQGATGEDVVPCFNEDGYGAIISASRLINYPHGADMTVSEATFRALVRMSVDNMNNDINEMLETNRLLHW